MAGLENIPTELILSICQALDDFDDLLRLRGCCRRLRGIIDVPEYRDSILRTIMNKIHLTQFSTAEAMAALMEQMSRQTPSISDMVLRWQSFEALQRPECTYQASEDDDYRILVEALRSDDPDYVGLPLSWAAARGVAPLVQMMLNEIEDVNAFRDLDMTPLCLAAQRGHERVVRMLLDKEAKTEQKDRTTFKTPLAWASFYGRANIVDMLLERGANIDPKQRHGKTPLCVAVESENDTMVKHLLLKGAQVRTRTSDGRTPLHHAVFCHKEEMLSILLDWCSTHGCEDLFVSRDNRGTTPLHDICSRGCSVNVIRCLTAGGYQACVFDNKGASPLMRALRSDSVIHGTEDEDDFFEKIKLLSKDPAVIIARTTTQQKTPLHAAAKWSDPRVLAWLLEHGGQSALNIPDASGRTPLIMALDEGNTKVVEYLLGALDIDVNCQMKSRRTALHLAAENCTPKEITSLLRLNPALLNDADVEGVTPLLEAFQCHKLENCKCLLEHGADASIANNYGVDPFRYATDETQEIELFDILLDYDHVSLDGGGNRLHKAVRGISTQRVIDVLHSPGINIFDQNEVGDTALHISVRSGCDEKTEEFTKILLKRDSTFTLASMPNNSGKTALDMALERGREDLIEMLVQTRWNSTLGLEWSEETSWIQKYSYQSWYPKLLRIIEASRPHLAAQRQLLVDQCGGMPLTVSREETELFKWTYTHRPGTQPYLSVKIPMKRHFPVRRLILATASHDTRVNDRDKIYEITDGGYIGSRTWFEVAVGKPSESYRSRSYREIYRDIHTSRWLRQHTAIWDARDPSPGVREWLSSIEGGDVLYIFPKPYKLGWCISVSEVTLTVFYERP
ncbi:ankyrin repeat-containing domain protein [Aspergillus avenaceus]|uniref:Ankyrin repeat-containing domain protein n=1 Tax=Aspergillus avenaceus TaxID=36643 RepID=A0A5N6U9F6_ASPAV|nr:ankyrin repeat-containing domain protein [Aspergillus avenaceus]